MKVLNIKQVREKLGGKSAATIYRLHKNEPKFPRFVKIGNSTGIIDADLEAYIVACRGHREGEAG